MQVIFRSSSATLVTLLTLLSFLLPKFVCVSLFLAGRVLQGKTSFLGQYPALDVIILTRRDSDTNQQLPRNQHTVRRNPNTHSAVVRPSSSLCLALTCSLLRRLSRVQLPPPFDSDEVRGDMLLVRMDKHSEPQPFTLTEWQQFVDAAGNVPSDSVHSGEKRTERDGGDAGMAGEKEGTDGASSAGVSRKKQRKT